MHLLLDTFVDRRNVFARNRTTHNLVHKLKAFCTFVLSGFETNPHMTVLTTATRLTNELTFDFCGVPDALTIGHLRLTNICLNAELAAHAINNDVEVQFTHT